MEGDIVLIEPDGLLRDGSYVLAVYQDEWIFRQLLRTGSGWRLRALNAAFGTIALDDLAAVRGVIIQKAVPGRRRASKRYID
ncbi:MAG: S24 family peptidase, partial [Alcaligenaceae bacterium]